MNGTRDEVVKTVDELPALIGSVQKAFDNTKPKTVATLTVKTAPLKTETRQQEQKFPRINPTPDSEEAVLRILETDWGKWRPRTIDELKDALKANGLNHPGRVLSGYLLKLAKDGRIRRWNTDAGFVYILAEKEAFGMRREA